MSYLTDRKRAVGMGAAKSGAHHHWHMIVTSVALLFLAPLFIFTVGPLLGAPHAEVVAHFTRPYPAAVAALTLLVGFIHFANGVPMMIDDYMPGLKGKITIIAMTCICYAAAAYGLIAIARMAL